MRNLRTEAGLSLIDFSDPDGAEGGSEDGVGEPLPTSPQRNTFRAHVQKCGIMIIIIMINFTRGQQKGME